jgi:flagella basal body P-ring formation protein FlgA
MTAPLLERRVRARAALVGILTLGAGALTLGARAEPWQAPASVRDAAEALVRGRLANASAARVEAVGVDSRLRLPECDRPLDAEMHREVRNGQGTVTVACAGANAWRLFVPVRVVEQVSVVLARRNLAAGEVLAAPDLDVRTQASTSLPVDFIGDPAQAIGLTMRRAVPAGSLLAAGALEQPLLVERGAIVTLVSRNGTVRVKSEGVALGTARLKQRVRVRSQSGRIVEGVVEASGEVRVGT